MIPSAIHTLELQNDKDKILARCLTEFTTPSDLLPPSPNTIPTPYQQITLSFKTHAPGGSLTFNLHVTFALLLCKSNSTFSPQTLEHSGIYPFSSIPSSSRPIIHCPISPARRESYMNSLLWEQRRRRMASRRRRPSRHLVVTRRRGATVRTSNVKVSPSMVMLVVKFVVERNEEKRVFT